MWFPDTEKENKPNKDKEELLVFGYACKLFQDDEKALYIDRGAHLIPWMGDNRLLIDRSVVVSSIHDTKVSICIDLRDLLIITAHISGVTIRTGSMCVYW